MPFFVAHHELVVTASMGISIYPRDGTDVSALRRNADAAMYEAKQAGKDRIRFYRPALGAAFQARLEMETDLRHALDRGELCLHYQPIYTAADNRQTAYEALSRWPHPEPWFRASRASSSHWRKRPDSSSGWASGCCARRAANAAGGRIMENPRSVSPSMFPPCSSPAPDFVDTVFGVLSETGLTGDLLDLELTESIVMRDIDSAIQKMAQLREHGVRISVDDFGTGYSSLGYLPKLPIDILKIDRCFVSQIGENDDAVPLIHGMISLGAQHRQASDRGRRGNHRPVGNSAQSEL